MALKGLLVAVQRGDREALFLKAKEEMTVEELEGVRRGIEARLSSPVIDDFDRGFFEQWVEVIKLLMDLKRGPAKRAEPARGEPEPQGT